MSHAQTVSRTSYGPLLRGVDAALGVAGAMGLPITNIDPDGILEAARRKTGLDDFGDPRFRVPMERIIRTARDLPFTNIARVAQRQAFIKAATNRLEHEAWRRAHPDVARVRVERPVFVLGFPRTGTTLLQNLLSLDGRRRALRFWEIMSPIPVHPDRAVDERRRVAIARNALRVAYRVAPEMAHVHWIDAETVEECWPLFANSFSVLNWDLQAGNRAYGEWLTTGWDMGWAYREYRRTLQSLLHQRPASQLVLKCPEHLWFVDELLETFPDACIVWTHRDPCDTIASYSSLISLQWRTLYGRFDPLDLGAYIEARFHEGIERAVSARKRADPARFFDVRFSELVQDPAAMVRRITDHFGLDHTPAGERAIATWLGNTRKDARGRHRYDPAFYGLDRAAIHDRYASYIDGFGVRVKAA